MEALKLLAVLVLVLLNGYFVAAEFALVSVRQTRIQELINQGNKNALLVHKIIQRMDTVIAATQLGITLASLGLGWIGEPALATLIDPLIAWVPPLAQSTIAHSVSATVSFLIITFLHIVVGELAPKSLGLQLPEQTALAVARPMLIAETIFKPGIILLNSAGNGLLRLLGLEPVTGHHMVHSVEELKMLVSASAESGVVDDEEEEMLHAVFAFGDILVRQVMVPRTEIIAVEANATLDEILALTREHPVTKFPVYEKDLDQIVGIVHVKDLLRVLLDQESRTLTARNLAREALFVPETLPAHLLLRQFRRQKQHIAIVVDEYGGTAGLVTLEDLLEEIVGEVSDPFDPTEPEIAVQPDGSALVDGLVLVEDVNQFFHLDLETPYYDTIAGYILDQLGRIPQEGDEVRTNGVTLRVERMNGLRIERIRLIRHQESEETPTA